MIERVYTRALVRPPGNSFAQAISSSNATIDVTLAQAQHQEYCQALVAAGLAVEVMPVDERYPDSCFMQDPALVIAGQGVVGRLAMPGRQGEETGAAQALGERGIPLVHIRAPGTLEGGDVLWLPDRVLVGLTARSNDSGIAQLAAILKPLDLPVTGVPVPDYLHLLTAVTYLGNGTVLALPGYAGLQGLRGLDIIVVPPEEAYAVNALGVRRSVVLPAGYPRVAQALMARGFNVLSVPMSEFARADGGITCLSLVW